MSSNSDSDSDFDDDEDPDKIQIPGFFFLGEKNLPSFSIPSQKVVTDPQKTLLKKVDNEQEKSYPKGHTSFAPGNFHPNPINNLLDLKAIAEEEEDLEEDNEMGIAETYADYMPRKLKLGKKHPDPVVETASLSSVEPADVWYKISIPTETIQTGALSALQLESITYASQKHEQILPNGCRAGFLVGDGAGVGKGRTIAGIIYENYLKGRKRSIWISVSNDLKYDAERDLKDIGASRIPVHLLSKLKYEKISSSANGDIKEGVIFTTYSALIGESSQSEGKIKSRLQQLLQWCGESFDGLIVFDECHRAKNLCPTGSSKPTKTGLTVLQLQEKLPKARIIYASATGASEPKNMAYMIRLGIWGKGTPFSDFNDFIVAVEKRGVGVMEIVAMDMKLRGMYIARQLSFHGVLFKSEEVPLTPNFIRMYDRSVKLWVEAMQKFQEASGLINAEERMKKTMWSQFWASHQRFFKYLCIAAKVKYAINLAHEAVKCGKCVVIGLQSTGEARTLEQLERDDGELCDFVSTAKGVFRSLIEKHFPAPNRERINNILGINLSQLVKEKTVEKSTSYSVLKRKSHNPVEEKPSKKVRSDNIQDEESSKGSFMDDFFKKMKEEEDDEDEDSVAEKSDSSSDDDNPFGSDSDSDLDPWDRKSKKELLNNEKSKKKNKNSSHGNNLLEQSKPNKLNNQLSEQSQFLNRNNQQKKDINHIQQYSVSRPVKVENSIESKYRNTLPVKNEVDRAQHLKEELLTKIEELGKDLPPNTLDQLIDELGGPENVAEMTGRKGRVIQMEDGSIQYESRNEVDVPLETLNLREKERFMNGEKLVAIISEAASSGISLQSDRRMRNQKRRVHITLELPWSADKAIQQFGRTHRSNQVNAPEYVFLISDLAGERRFASTVAKRLESLGALTHGDRRATKTRDLSQYNIDNNYGQSALGTVMRVIMNYEAPLVPPPQDYNGNFFKDATDALIGVGLIHINENSTDSLSLDKDYNNISKFLNRLLGVPVNLQNHLFKYFTDTLNAVIDKAKKNGRFDMGILDLGTSGKTVRRKRLIRYFRKHATGIAPTELHVVHVESGMSWSEIMDHWHDVTGKNDGFYVSRQERNGKRTIILAEAVQSNDQQNNFEADNNQLYMIYRPNTGLQLRQETLSELKQKYKKVSLEDAELHWTKQYKASADVCSHAFWRGSCKNIILGRKCDVGLRHRSYNVIAGSVLSIWTRIEMVMTDRNHSKMQVVRLRTDDDQKLIGILVPNICVLSIQKALAEDAERIEEKTFEDN